MPRTVAGVGIMRRLRRSGAIYMFMAPAIIYYAIFFYWPMYGIVLAFKRYVPKLGFMGSPWVGTYYFNNFFSSKLCGQLIWNTFILAFYGLVVSYAVTVAFALLLNEISMPRYKKFVQTAVYAPNFISMVVLVGMIKLFFADDGPINGILAALGVESVPFLTRPSIFRHMYVWSGVWQGTGWGTVIYFAVLAGVDHEQYEAAIIDGASRFQRMIYINLPALLPTMTIQLILSCGGLLSVGFEKVFLMQNALNKSAANVISTYVYEVGLVNSNFSFSTAVGLFNSVINCALLCLVNLFARKVSEVSLW